MDTLTLAHYLPPAFMAILGLALLAYVVLDGHDLGLGILLPLASHAEKDAMVSSIGPFWDANELWLALGIGVLLTCFPHAHHLVLPALYLPLAAMLLGLALRAVAFELRRKAQPRTARRALCNRVFAGGSLAAALAQGWMLGACVTGFHSDLWGVLFSLGIAITLPAAYAMLGAGWLIMKTGGELRRKAARWGQGALWPMGFALMGVSLASPLVSPTVFAKWFALPQLFVLLPIPLACVAAFFAIRYVLCAPSVVQAGHGWTVFAATALIFVLAFCGLAYSLYPFVVIDRLTVWQAAGPADSLVAMGIGMAVTLPAVAARTVSVHRSSWGKAEQLPAGQ